MMAYIDTHRGLMLWDSRQHDEPPAELPADYGTHHSSHVATAPIEGGIFYTLPCRFLSRAALSSDGSDCAVLSTMGTSLAEQSRSKLLWKLAQQGSSCMCYHISMPPVS